VSDPVAEDPVSWLLIRPGWRVVSSDGIEIGKVDEVAGDDTEDIFDGLAVATSALGEPRYVLSEQVAGITQGRIVLTLTATDADELPEYLEPASSKEIEPESKSSIGEEIGADVRESRDECSHRRNGTSITGTFGGGSRSGFAASARSDGRRAFRALDQLDLVAESDLAALEDVREHAALPVDLRAQPLAELIHPLARVAHHRDLE
jgi:hypothetical protein